MNPKDAALMAAVLIAAPFLGTLGHALDKWASTIEVPAFCHRHGWVSSPCEQCAVWETRHYSSDQERADRIEAAALRQYRGAESGS